MVTAGERFGRHYKMYGQGCRQYTLGYLRHKLGFPRVKGSGWYEGEPLRNNPQRSWKYQTKKRHQYEIHFK